jgi:hypothetical protein
VEQLARLAEEAGITLIQLAIAFVLNHPAVTSPLIGPRTMEQLESQLAGADIVLDEAVLDRIDEIVPPGTTINPADNSWANPALLPSARRPRGASLFGMRARPAGPAQSSALHNFARSGPTKEAHRRAIYRSGGLLTL